MIIPRPQSKQPMPPDAKKVFSGVVFDVYQWEQTLFTGEAATFEKLKRADNVTVFGVLDDGNVLLTRQEQSGREPFIGGAGGRVDEGEDIIAAAKRELLEETGYTASEFVLWDARHPTSKIDFVVYTFIAKGLKKVAEMDLDGGERVELMPVTFDEFVDIATNDELFAEREIVHTIYEARLDPRKMEELRLLFRP